MMERGRFNSSLRRGVCEATCCENQRVQKVAWKGGLER